MHAKPFMMLIALAVSACGGSTQAPVVRDSEKLEVSGPPSTEAEWRYSISQNFGIVYIDPKSGATVVATVINVPDASEKGGFIDLGKSIAMSAPTLPSHCPLTWGRDGTFTVQGPPEVSKNYGGDVANVMTRQKFSDATSGAVYVVMGQDGSGFVVCGRWSSVNDETMFLDFLYIVESLSLPTKEDVP